MSRRRAAFGGVLAAAAASVAATLLVVGGHRPADAGARPDFGASAVQNIAALHRPGTALPGIPRLATRLGSDFAPAPGTVHELGGGLIQAWEHQGQVCYMSTKMSGGCFGQFLSPVNATLGDPDEFGSGQPSFVYGIVADDVRRLEVVLDDGRRLAAPLTGNAFDVELPADAAPWNVVGERLVLADGQTLLDDEHVSKLPTS
jgi:hypothetical protein